MALGGTRTRIVLAFATLYLVWGSTYIAMKYAVETIPPVLMAGTRFGLAGLVMLAIARARGATMPTPIQWRTSAIVGGLLMGGNSCVAIAVKRIPSGVAALIVAMSALWFIILDWLRPHGKRPRPGVVAGLVVGLVGVAILIGPSNLLGGAPVDTIGALIVMAGTIAWSGGSIYSRHAPRPVSSLMSTATQMLCGGAILIVVALVLGDARRFDPHGLTTRSLVAYGYLLLIGSLVGYTAYVYLLEVSTPALVSTYAYVNPLVAVFLGWAIGGEAVSARILVAATIIIAGVALITVSDAPAPPPPPPRTGRPESRDEIIRRHTDELPVPDSV